MTVISCPVCGQRVNAKAVHCPQCGADPGLPPGEAGAELAMREKAAPWLANRQMVWPRSSAPPLPGWSRRRRVVVAIPGFVLPVLVLVSSGVLFVASWNDYYSLSPMDRGGDARGWFDFGIEIALTAALIALLLAALAAAVTLPRRLDGGLAVFLLIAGLVPLGLVVYIATAILVRSYAGESLWFVLLLACLLFAYIPAVTVARLVWQRSRGRP
jgi:hypothetical protein